MVVTCVRGSMRKGDSYVAAYCRVSTVEQALSGAGIAAQRMMIETYCVARSVSVSKWHIDDGVSGAVPPEDRPQLSNALSALRRVRSGGLLVVARPDRLARKASDLLNIRDRAEAERWMIASADGSLDMSTPHGRAMATVMGAFAELERDLARARTREALAARKAAGVRLGRPQAICDEVILQILAARQEGASLSAIAAQLSVAGVPTVRPGARWHASTIAAVVRSQRAAELLHGRTSRAEISA